MRSEQAPRIAHNAYYIFNWLSLSDSEILQRKSEIAMNLDCLLIKSKSIKKTFVGRSFGTEIPRLRSRAAMVSVPTVAIVNGRRDKESKDSAAAAAESAPICSSYGTSVG